MVLFAGNTVWSISERVRCVCVDALYKSMFTLLYFTSLYHIWHWWANSVCSLSVGYSFQFLIFFSVFRMQNRRFFVLFELTEGWMLGQYHCSNVIFRFKSDIMLETIPTVTHTRTCVVYSCCHFVEMYLIVASEAKYSADWSSSIADPNDWDRLKG